MRSIDSLARIERRQSIARGRKRRSLVGFIVGEAVRGTRRAVLALRRVLKPARGIVIDRIENIPHARRHASSDLGEQDKGDDDAEYGAEAGLLLRSLFGRSGLAAFRPDRRLGLFHSLAERVLRPPRRRVRHRLAQAVGNAFRMGMLLQEGCHRRTPSRSCGRSSARRRASRLRRCSLICAGCLRGRALRASEEPAVALAASFFSSSRRRASMRSFADTSRTLGEALSADFPGRPAGAAGAAGFAGEAGTAGAAGTP